MVRHTDDNDKKPRPRQRPFGEDRPRTPGSGGEIKGKRYSAGGSSDRSGDFAKDRPKARVSGKGGEKTPAEPKRMERIAKAMARSGIASRREVERLIGLGKVAVNGRILDTPATLVSRDDKITVDGKPIAAAQATRVWRYNKPVGLLTSHSDPGGRPTVFDNLPGGLPRVISVGRLDINTEGLLLLTNDGELSRALELPTTALVRQYRARARGRITQAQLDTLKEGCTVDGVRYGPVEATIDKAKTNEDGGQSANLWLSVQITEGKNREVRKVLESVGLTVNRLIRLAYGPFQLGTLALGSVEEVGPRVIRELLGEHIRPENLPQGSTVETPVPVPGRRSSTPVLKGRSGSALSDPSRKPSRVRAADAAAEAGTARAASPPKKGAGWAKAKPRFEHPKRDFKPRARPDGDVPGGRAGEQEDRPRRAFKPREDKIIGPKSPTWARDGRDGDRNPRQHGSGSSSSGEGDRGGVPRSGPPRSGPPRSGPPRSGPPRSGPPRSGAPRTGAPRPGPKRP